MTRKKPSAQYYERKIRDAVGLFTGGCIVFIVLECVLIYLGYFTIANPAAGWPKSLFLLGVAGVWLLVEMVAAMNFGAPLPAGYEKVELEKLPELQGSIRDVSARLGLPVPADIYMAPGIEAAVFCRPTMLSVFRKPRRELVIGRTLLRFLTDDELKAILYHEFGHYSSGSLDKKTPTYIVAQFAKSFTATRKIEKQDTWSNVIGSQVALFSYFSLWMCSKIERYYREISMAEEYAADDVARRHVGDTVLAATLAKVAVLQYNLRYLRWAGRQMKDAPAVDEGMVLAFLCRHNKVGADDAVPPLVRARLSRLDWRAGGNPSAAVNPVDGLSEPQLTASLRLARSLVATHGRYVVTRNMLRSVGLRIYLGYRKHRLPLFDGQYQVLLDGKPVGKGNFIKGYNLNVRTSPGNHVIGVYAPTGIRSIPMEISCESGTRYLVEMDFRVHLWKGYYDVYAASVRPDS